MNTAIWAILSFLSPVCADGTTHASLHGRHVVGYQGWFDCPNNGKGSWHHWFRGTLRGPTGLAVDMWPANANIPDSELCDTAMTFPDGRPAKAFSSSERQTVRRHFQWMKDHEIDGAALQRFVVELQSSTEHRRRDVVLENVAAAAENTGRGFFVMYDISGADPRTFVQTVLDDWRALTATSALSQRPGYWWHDGKPVVAVWGLGFTDRPGTAADAKALLAGLRSTPGGVTLIGGVPTGWRTLSGDAKSDVAWREIYRSFDIMSPWTVGRYRDVASWRRHLTTVTMPDLDAASGARQGYLPVVYPGFSFRNGGGNDPARFNKIPRRCGAFYWSQVKDLFRSGRVDMLYTAMFDEIDEGTAIMPTAAHHDATPSGAELVTLDQDGCDLTPDWYLQIAGRASLALHGRRDLIDAPLVAPLEPAAADRR